MQAVSDYDLIKKFLEGNESAFNELLKRYQSKIYWHARRMLGNHFDADEITQQVIIVLYKKLKTFEFKSSFYTWVFRITHNQALNYIKKMKLKSFLPIDSDSAKNLRTNEDVVKNTEDKESLERLNEILKELPVKQREVFLLRRFEELSYEEIAEITGKSVGALKANYFHAIKKITEKMNVE